jgi:hypothetical protein
MVYDASITNRYFCDDTFTRLHNRISKVDDFRSLLLLLTLLTDRTAEPKRTE